MTTSSHASQRNTATVILNPDGGYLTFINTFKVNPDNAEKLLEALNSATEKIFRHMPGFISVSLHISTDRSRVVNYAQWRSKEDYRAMSENPEVQAHMKGAAALALSFDPVDYELKHVVLPG